MVESSWSRVRGMARQHERRRFLPGARLSFRASILPKPLSKFVHETRKTGNGHEVLRNPKTLKSTDEHKISNDFKWIKIASQAYDEGSIPFTRSMISSG